MSLREYEIIPYISLDDYGSDFVMLVTGFDEREVDFNDGKGPKKHLYLRGLVNEEKDERQIRLNTYSVSNLLKFGIERAGNLKGSNVQFVKDPQGWWELKKILKE